MFNMIFKIVHYLGFVRKFEILRIFGKTADLNINTRLMFNMILKFAHYLYI